MKTTQGTYMAILRDGTHLIATAHHYSFSEFKGFVQSGLKGVKLGWMCYAWGEEVQRYSYDEAVEVFQI